MRRLGTDVEQTKQEIERLLRPIFTAMWQQAAVSPLAFMDVGQAVAQATLVAYDEGLGTCLMSSPTMLDKVNKLLKLPETATLVCVMSVGYPAESWEAGGQRPRPPFEELYFEGKYGVPFKRDEKVVEKLKEAKMIQAPAPLSGRTEEVRELSRRFGLPE